MALPYVIYLAWRDFCARLPERGTVQTQVLLEVRSGTMPTAQTFLVATCGTTDRVQAIQLPVEDADLLLPTATERRQRQQRMYERADLALLCAQVTLPTPIDVAPGMLLVPGLYDDLKRMGGSADLWRWEGERRNPDARRLVPAPHLADRVARHQQEIAALCDDNDANDANERKD